MKAHLMYLSKKNLYGWEDMIQWCYLMGVKTDGFYHHFYFA